jgi:hypothetical protein
VDATTSPDPLRLGECPSCGYALEGLAPQGRCPECGGRYDQSAVVLHGYAAGRFADVATARPWHAAGIAGAWVLLFLLWVRDWVRHGRRDEFGMYCAVVGVAWLGWTLWKRWTRDMPGLVQVRLNASGARYVKNPLPGKRPGGTLIPWRDVAGVSIEPAEGGMVRLRLAGRKSFWNGSEVALEAELRCTPEQAGALRERIGAWREADAAEREAAPT